MAFYEALNREVERNEGNFTGTPTHPLLSDVLQEVEDEPEPTSIKKLFADYRGSRKKIGKARKR